MSSRVSWSCRLLTLEAAVIGEDQCRRAEDANLHSIPRRQSVPHCRNRDEAKAMVVEWNLVLVAALVAIEHTS